MPLLAYLLVGLLLTYSSIADLECYSGHQRWEPEPVINEISLTKCAPSDGCCYMISSFNGTYYGCYRECPTQPAHACGPDPTLRIMDVYYCYCNSSSDTNCQPYLGKST